MCMCNSLFDDDGQMSVKTTATMGEEMLAYWASNGIPSSKSFVQFTESTIPPMRYRTAPPTFTKKASDTSSDTDDTRMSEHILDSDSEGDLEDVKSVDAFGNQWTQTAGFDQVCHRADGNMLLPLRTSDESDSESILELMDDAVCSEPEISKRLLWADEDVHEPLARQKYTLARQKYPFSPKEPTTDGIELPSMVKREFIKDTGVLKYELTIPHGEFRSTNTSKSCPKFDLFFKEGDVSGQVTLFPVESNWRKSNGHGRVSLKVPDAGIVPFRISVGSRSLTAETHDFASNSQKTCADIVNFQQTAKVDAVVTLELLPPEWQ